MFYNIFKGQWWKLFDSSYVFLNCNDNKQFWVVFVCLCQFKSFFDEFYCIQHFFVGKVIDGHTYESFEVSDLVMNRTADEGGISLVIGATQTNLDFFVASAEAERLLEVVMYEIQVITSIPQDISSGILVSRFFG